MIVKDIAYRVADLVADVCQSALDSIKAPARVLVGKAQHEIHDHLPNAWPTDRALSPSTVIPFLRDELSMPAQDGVRRE